MSVDTPEAPFHPMTREQALLRLAISAAVDQSIRDCPDSEGRLAHFLGALTARAGWDADGTEALLSELLHQGIRPGARAAHYCRCCGEQCPDGEDCCTDDFPEPGDLREEGVIR